MDKKSVFLIGVIGGLVGYACGQLATPGSARAQQGQTGDTGGGTGSAGGGADNTGGGWVPPASGTPNIVPPWECQHWEIKGLSTNGNALLKPGNPVVAVEAGWEPIQYSYESELVVLRRCVH